VDRYQLEAAESIGLTLVQAYRRIVIPQAMAAALPVFCSSVTDLIKLTSLAFLMTIQDVTGICKIEGGTSLSYIEAYMAMALVYLIIVWCVERVFKLAERRVVLFRKG
ncbi:MAG: ABC transporter permease subunit, partial [Clostridiales Family XIII bacterium]|nr:ABC transporter permease subunit [Clostridiales Family XIII bacterium]